MGVTQNTIKRYREKSGGKYQKLICVVTNENIRIYFENEMLKKITNWPILVCVFDVITNEITLVERPRNYHILTTDKQTNKQTNKQTHKQTNYFVKKVSNISHSASGNE